MADKRNKKVEADFSTENPKAQDESLQSAEKSIEELFPCEAGRKPDYGTNDTLELLDKIPNRIVEMRLDDVLTAVKDVDNLCDFQRCKTKTSLMGQNCDLCRKKFCFKHGLPEVHGCGEAVKKDERKKFLHPKPMKTIRKEQELAQAKTKLQTKLKDMQINRTQKTGGGTSNGKKKKGKQ